MRSVSGNDDDCDDNECRDQRKSAIMFSIRASGRRRAEAWPISAAVVRRRTSQQPRISSDPTLSRFVRRDRIWRIRTCEVQILWAPARSARASCAFGISGSGVAELRAVGLRLGNRSWHSTLDQAGAQNSQSPVDANAGTVMEPLCSSGFRRHRSLLLTFEKINDWPTWPANSRSFTPFRLRRRLPLYPDRQIVTEPGRHFAFVPAAHSCTSRAKSHHRCSARAGT